ncbi:MAG: hypothetical protein IJR48_04805, partial [Oscillibacter sp.]|nr:hypothetical protein [Oscillibacter sp.]
SLPDWIAELPTLENLLLLHCRIQSIPYSLVKTGLPFVMSGLPSNGRGIFLYDDALEEGDIGLFSQPREVIEAYYKGREDRARQSVRECKVIFLGKGGAGKSSLIQRMEFPEQELDPNSLPTNGVSVTKWNVTAPDGPMSLRVMDFGGQEIMHSMHRCFLTAHTVYVVVCDSREDGGVDAEAVMWVEAVKTFAPDCPVILALNKADLSGNVSVDAKDLKRRNPNLKTVLRTSALVAPNHSGYGVGLLEEAILREVPGCMDRMEVSPEWLAVKRELEDMVEKDIDTFTAADYREICIKHNTDGDDALRFKMLEYFKTIGVAYFYNPTDGAPDYSLESIRVSNPAWITNGIYRLIIKADDIGFLPKREIREILKTPYDGETLPGRIYDGEKADFILHVMRMFHISMPFGKDTELVPMKMPKEPPDSADDYPFGKAIHLRWEASYLPDNLVHRLIIDMSRNLYEGPDGHYCVWRRGARFRRNGCDALSRMDDKGLDAFVYGADSDAARAYMENFRETVAGILLDLHIDAAEMIYYTKDGFEGKIPCKDAMEQISRRPEQELFIPSTGPGPGQYVGARDLLGSVYADWEEKVALFQSIRERDLGLRGKELDLAKKEREIRREEAQTEQVIIENDSKRREAQWKKWLVRGFAALLLLVTVVLIALTITHVINWPTVLQSAISFIFLWLFMKAKLEKE